jgi:ribosomal protein L24
VRPTRTSKGGIIEMEMPLNISNVQFCAEGDKPVKLRVKHNFAGQKELYYNEGQNQVVYRTL